MLLFLFAVVTVGFQPVNYTFNEVDGFAVLTVVLLQGALERDVTVQFSTTPGTATEAGVALVSDAVIRSCDY